MAGKEKPMNTKFLRAYMAICEKLGLEPCWDGLKEHESLVTEVAYRARCKEIGWIFSEKGLAEFRRLVKFGVYKLATYGWKEAL